MNEFTKRLLHWAPRILGFLFAGFLALFATDVINDTKGFWETLAAFAMHLIPTVLVLLCVGLAWRHEWIGGIAFTALGVLYIALSWGRFPLATYFVIAGPLVLIGALFFLNWARRAERSPA